MRTEGEDPGMKREYLDNLSTHVDEGGTLTHQNAVALLSEVLRLRGLLKQASADATTCGETVGPGQPLREALTEPKHRCYRAALILDALDEA